ncbi:MAG TPA: 16S rRNA (guanine(527)-N(7))-methyltransferase RsmG [Terriglobales bacterium]|jgi:16S rRNA (guanine527-N7)-methyltransferase|nr:16S rRNA (guanine(527)-N(7))-methyltransferase RsmG [Terriglobales bacterium]
MYTIRIAELLRPFLRDEESAALSQAQLDLISIYIDLLLRWNARINLTSIRDPEEIVTRHFGESLFVARHLFPAPARLGTGVLTCPAERSSAERVSPDVHLIDVGSGAGFPGLPIKIWATQVQVTLIESSQKKATFLREVVRALTLTNTDVFAGRAADFLALGPVVTLRAVERFDSILPTAASLVAARGRLAVLVGESQVKRVRDLAPAVRWAQPLSLPLSSKRVLIIGSKEPD